MGGGRGWVPLSLPARQARAGDTAQPGPIRSKSRSALQRRDFPAPRGHAPATDRARASVYFGQLGEAGLQLLVGGDVVGHHTVVELLVGGHVEVPGARQAEDDGLGLAGLFAL